jgi:hypothetical protein
VLEVYSRAKVALGSAAHYLYTKSVKDGALGATGLYDAFIRINGRTR